MVGLDVEQTALGDGVLDGETGNQTSDHGDGCALHDLLAQSDVEGIDLFFAESFVHDIPFRDKNKRRSITQFKARLYVDLRLGTFAISTIFSL